MKILFIFGIVILNIIIHELAHALAMLKNGVNVKEIEIGLFKIRIIPLKLNLYLSKRCKITFRDKTHHFNLVLSPFLLGAYVKPANEKEIETLSYKQKASIFGAGVVANLIFGFILLVPLTIISALTAGLATVNILKVILICSMAALIAFLLFKLSRYFSMIMPLFSTALLTFIVWSLIRVGIGNTMVGPVGIVVIASKTQSFLELFWLGIAIALGIGMANMLPLFPLDGGLMFLSFLEKCFGRKKRLRDIFKVVGVILFLLLIMAVIFSDFARL